LLGFEDFASAVGSGDDRLQVLTRWAIYRDVHVALWKGNSNTVLLKLFEDSSCYNLASYSAASVPVSFI